MKNCKGKAPAFQFYVKDWLSDPELQKAHPTTRGIWINLLCYMWDAPDRGKLETNERELCQLGSCLLEDIKVFLFDAERLDFCDISVTCHADVTSNHADVTIENRRMVREQHERQGARTRKQKQRERESEQEQTEGQLSNSHGNVTPPSPIPTPIPTPIATTKPKNKDLKPIVEKSEIPFKEIIEYLNLKTGKRYQHTTPKTQNFIKARWGEGFKSLDDYKHVIDVKCHKWLNTEDEKYLRPETLFGTKFEGYLNERIIENPQPSQIPKATTVYQADMLQKEAVNQEYLRQRRQEENGESNCGHQDVVDIENNPRAISQTD